MSVASGNCRLAASERETATATLGHLQQRRAHTVIRLRDLVEHPAEVTSILGCHRTILPPTVPACRYEPHRTGTPNVGVRVPLFAPDRRLGAPPLGVDLRS